MPSQKFEIRLFREALEQLNALDRPVAQRIWDKLQWLGENAEQVRHEPLTAHFGGLYKRRVGDYRIIYELLKNRETIIVHRVGHRAHIYDDR